MKKIPIKFTMLLLVLSVAIFLTGLFETTRNEFMFPIAEDNFMNLEQLPEDIYDDYLEFKGTYIFENIIFTTIINFLGLVLIFYLMLDAWIVGRKSPIYQLTDVFNAYGLALILAVYIATLIATYIFDIFVNQLIKDLFIEIYNAIWIYPIFVDYFFALILLAYTLSFLSNQIKYFDILK